jgi:hypothetical protein
MKKPISLLALGLFSSLASFSNLPAQGLVNFFNNANTWVRAPGPMYDTIPYYYFALLTSPVGAGNFTFAGVLATNSLGTYQAVAGLFNGGRDVAVPGWLPGTARDFEVVGWGGASPTYNPSWVNSAGVFFVNEHTPLFYGESSWGSGVAGGATSSGTLPALDIFGGATGIQYGFVLSFNTIPEPSVASLMVLGTGVMFAFHRRCGRTPCTRTPR